VAWAQDAPATGPYLRLDSGGSFTEPDLGRSYIIGGGAGYRVTPQFRADITVSYRGNYGFNRTVSSANAVAPNATVTNKADRDALVSLISGYYDIVTYGGFTPYFVAGLGVSVNHYGDTFLSSSGLAFSGPPSAISGHTRADLAWQLGTGISYSIAPQWSVELGYRYLDMGTIRTGDTFILEGHSYPGLAPVTKFDLQAHEIAIALRYAF
jgi:opacity protein-like surface antigen